MKFKFNEKTTFCQEIITWWSHVLGQIILYWVIVFFYGYIKKTMGGEMCHRGIWEIG